VTNAKKSTLEQTTGDSATNALEDLSQQPDDLQAKSEATKNRRQLTGLVTQIRRNGRLLKYRGPGQKNKSRRRSLFPLFRHSPEFRDILKYFIEPVIAYDTMKHKDPTTGAERQTNITAALDVFFGTKVRDIVPAIVFNSFKMPGMVWNPDDGTFRPPTVNDILSNESIANPAVLFLFS
jgi:hypothetical protein